jgi:hypothetical protein
VRGIFEYLKQEWAVLTKAPLSFIGLALVFFAAGIGVGLWHYSERLNEKDGQIGRYRVALGIDKASEGALIELSNIELQAKALNTVGKLRDMCSLYNKRTATVQADFNAGKTDQKGKDERVTAIDTEMSNEFVRNLRADSFNVDNELRRRLGPKAVAAIVGISPSLVDNEGNRIDLLTVVAGSESGFSVTFTCTLADGIEQMAKLLPLDSGRQ